MFDILYLELSLLIGGVYCLVAFLYKLGKNGLKENSDVAHRKTCSLTLYLLDETCNNARKPTQLQYSRLRASFIFMMTLCTDRLSCYIFFISLPSGTICMQERQVLFLELGDWHDWQDVFIDFTWVHIDCHHLF